MKSSSDARRFACRRRLPPGLALTSRRSGGPSGRRRPTKVRRRRDGGDRAPSPGRGPVVHSLPCSSSIARTRPWAGPATIASPTFSVPRWTAGWSPWPRARHGRGCARSDPARPGRVGPQVQAGVRRQHDGLEQLLDVRAGRRTRRRTSCRRRTPRGQAVLGQLATDLGRVGALDLSILLTATTIGTWPPLAWLSASTVCGITPSSAATTRIAMSVTWHHGHASVNAS